MKAGKLNVDQINFLGYTFSSVEQQRLQEIDDELEYELDAAYEEDEDEDDDFLSDNNDIEEEDTSSL